MCGIAGFLNRPSNWKDDIILMNNRMIHRGPDAQAYWTNEDHKVVLGHARLSIVDLSETGNQPMISHDGRYILVLNGEIYNHRELKKKLIDEKKVSGFRGHSDTEILLEYIVAYGFEQALKSSIGMFAVGMFDKKEKQLYLGRDRIGEKPLYIGFIDNNFIFASDIGCIEELGKGKLELDCDALTLYFKYGYIPAPYTVFKGIQKVEAGSIVEIKEPYHNFRQYKYWDIMEVAKYGQTHPFCGTELEATNRLEELLKASIKYQMMADVPVGAFLSGGIDSTAVVAIMQKMSSNKVKTFSIGFEEELYNEAICSKKTSEYLGTDHTELYVTSKDIIDVIPKLPHIYSEPFADSSQLPTYLVSKLAKEKVTVSLSGDGGDELFCGYNSYFSVLKIWNKIRNIPMPLRKMSCISINKSGLVNRRYLNKIAYFLDATSPEEIYLRSSFIEEVDGIVLNGKIPSYKYTDYPIGFLKENERENLMLMDMLMYHPDDILVKVDRSAMAVSLESRVPLLDKNLVEFAWTLPHRYKEDGITRKKVLKNVLYRYVPKEMMERPKKGFSIPVADWILKGQLMQWAEDLLSERKICMEGVLDARKVRIMWNNFKKDGRGASHIWYLLMFEEWLQDRHL